MTELMELIQTVHVSADKGAEELDRLRRLLCIKRAIVQDMHRDICGRLYQQACSPSPLPTCVAAVVTQLSRRANRPPSSICLRKVTFVCRQTRSFDMAKY